MAKIKKAVRTAAFDVVVSFGLLGFLVWAASVWATLPTPSPMQENPTIPAEGPKPPPTIPITDPPKRFPESGNRKPPRVAVVSDDLLRALQWVESRNNPKAVGTSGERGLFQIMPETWRQHTSKPFDKAFVPEENKRIAVLHLRWIEDNIRKNGHTPTPAAVSACYNAGLERMKRVGFDVRRAPASTREYVKRVQVAMGGADPE